MFILPGITRSGLRKEGMGFCRELPAHRRGIHPRKGILPEITISFTLIQTDKIKMRGKSTKWYNIFRISSSNSSVLPMPTKKNFNMKTSLN
jgi:hypothetical protein